MSPPLTEAIWWNHPWIQTYTGQAFDLLDPRPEQIDPLDIAHALSQICRFTGHVRVFYSVAQHSCLVAEIVQDLCKGAYGAVCPDVGSLQALLHDAPEAYIGDVSTPLKRALRGEGTISEYDVVEARIADAIEARFFSGKASHWSRTLIKRADMIALATEHAALFTGPTPRPWGLDLPQPWPYKIEPWAPAKAQAEFLQALCFYGGC
jgi:5'-deoxynucleotidase YfbR-like HD superfamily hydrolase